MSARRWWAWPLVPLYAAGIWVKDRLRAEPKKLGWPVVSVGSLSAGGAGKTPVVLALAALLQQRGWQLDVLSRGYGGAASRKKNFAAQVELGREDAAGFYGDEPVFLASKDVTVWVGADRFFAGQTAEYVAAEKPYEFQRETLRPGAVGRSVHLLDDGFQHRQLARRFDVVLVTAEDIGDALLPAGNLREGFRALRRADAVVIRERERERLLPFVKSWGRPGVAVWVIRRKLRFETPLAVLGAGLRPMAFCAIARPEDFAAMVAAAGCGIVDTLVFADHHAYAMKDMDEIVATARRLKVSGFVTTEKDAVKLTAAMRAKLAEVGELVVAALVVEFVETEAVVTSIEGKIA